MKRVLLAIGGMIVLLAAIILARTFSTTSMQLAAKAAAPLRIDRAAALAHFSRAIQFRTVSYAERRDTADGAHAAFIAWVAQTYPRVHASLQREVISGKSLLYTWRGGDAALPPVLLMGHYDVVPVEPGTESKWEQPPFSGAVTGSGRGGFIWGRGTLDDKITVVSILESAESLLAEGFQPQRTLLFAFGHDEELGGAEGASQTAKLLASRGVKLDAVIDEGGLIMNATLGLTRPLALVGIAEKGMVSVELIASGSGGHSSMPPPRTEVGVIASAVDRVQRRPFPASIRGATAELFRWIAPELPFGKRVVMSNLWLFAPLVKAQARESNSLNATMRTTTAPTIIRGGVKDNVIPSEARAVINFRILPGDTVDSVFAHVRRATEGEHLRLLLHDGQNPSIVSDARAPQFRRMQTAITQVYPSAIVAPYLVVGATDARHFAPLTANIYRFIPIRLGEGDLARFHGTNERISVDDYFESIRFYRTLMTGAAE
jgi:carboxypeptidase PM20D1